ncbi:hypothetical protein Tco_1090665 [Tanacetum coccineum]|uniref:Uncharacterized protein n=1 Tax=Tanacetum coccineum TaxID=301880 RepID=A0ABQ5I4W8_9ASTR
MHNNIMAAGSRDRLPMLAKGRYAQWQSRFMRYIDIRPNGEALKKFILQGSPSFGAPRDLSYENIATKQIESFYGSFGGDGEEDVVIGEGVVVTSSSLEILTKSWLGEIMVSLIFLEGLEEEA